MRYLTIMILTCLCVQAFICAAHKTRMSVTADVYDVRNTRMPHEDVRKHLYHDVAVYRNLKEGNNYYEVRFYCNAEDTLCCFHLDWFSENDLDKVRYSWHNDTIVAVSLYQKHGKMRKKFLLSGSSYNGANSTLSLHVH